MKDPATTVVNEWPMIMVHDAATTYLAGGLLHQVNNWAKVGKHRALHPTGRDLLGFSAIAHMFWCVWQLTDPLGSLTAAHSYIGNIF